MRSSSRQRGLGWMLLSLMKLLEAKKTAQPQEQNPKDDLLGHRRTQPTIEPKPRPRRRWLWRKGGRIGVDSKFFNLCSCTGARCASRVKGYRLSGGAITDAKRRPTSIPVIMAFGLMPDGGGCSLTAPDNLARSSGFVHDDPPCHLPKNHARSPRSARKYSIFSRSGLRSRSPA